MRLRGDLGDVGARWLERFAPVFERLGSEVTVMFSPQTIILLQSARATGGIDAHADLRVDEVFERLKMTSANDDKIAARLEPSALSRALRGMIALEATRVEARLVKRAASAESRAMPYLNFTAIDGRAEVSQDVPIVGPLNRAEVAACEKIVEANVVDVPYWLDCDRFALESVRETVERFARVSDFVEVTTTRSGSLYVTASRGSVRMLGSEYRGLRVLPAEADEYDERADDAGGVASRLAEIKSSGIGNTVMLSVKHLQRGLLGCASNPSNLLVGISSRGNYFELVFRYGAQTERDGDSVGFMVRIPVVADEQPE
ncbi:Checkpoint protein Hus1/Mec3 [Ostreococcus tauri]|uniref:Checkpoint protein Hus1/Mec3 n=1 Tax=Ostreococcus tauri TaxID=70448 RepID=A0A090M1K2_OSTTA|nr:Checkpoint protein Hus1/Mec3 [Ostreococcus tauri]OUS47805.1 checkpoint protein Hus1/Mec3 [Ostreococcus tauri]CEF98115.1 Checkpoint protein Hus1/Mec3 [Ostreococcus tauri]|eukprot:XP_003079525.2 Checkpoint protein Hus1/Mec3 [Ostreococcus tauri]